MEVEMDDVSRILALAAILGTGLVGGVFFAFSSFVMRALGRLPADRGHEAMNSINVVVLNWHFLGAFLGTAGVSLAAVVVAVLGWGEAGATFHLAGGALYFVGTFLVTGLGNVPLNNALAAARPEDPEAEEVWKHYLRRWTALNHVRTAAALLATVLFSVGLVQAGAAG
jgi:uncharacterized membrane protein